MGKIQINRCNFEEIFDFAKEKYGIEWNDANNLFFHNILRYKNITKIELVGLEDNCYCDDILSDHFLHKPGGISIENIKAMDKSEVFRFDDMTKASIIMINFMAFHNIAKLEVNGN